MKAVENIAKRKATGGRRKPHRSRRAYEADRYAAETVLGEAELVKKRVRGGNLRFMLAKIDYANVYDPSAKRSSRVRILRVLRNPADRDYDRRGVMTKGAIVETELGEARLTSRPGQHGIVNAVLLK